MQYWIARNNHKLGPYSLEDVQRMAADGKFVTTDLAWTKGMANWAPVFEVIPVPQPSAAQPTPPAGPEALAPTRMIPVFRPPEVDQRPAQMVNPAPVQVTPAPAAPAPAQPVMAPIPPAPAQPAFMPTPAAPTQAPTQAPNQMPTQTFEMPVPAHTPARHPSQPIAAPPPPAAQPFHLPAQPPPPQPFQPEPYQPQQAQPQPYPAQQPYPSQQPLPPQQPFPPPQLYQSQQPYQPQPFPPPPAQPYSGQPMQQPQQFQGPPASGGPVPPGMHWALVLVLGSVTFGIFYIVWIIKQLKFIKTIDPRNESGKLLMLALGLLVFYIVLLGGAAVMQSTSLMVIVGSLGMLINLGITACSIIAYFKIRTSMLNYYNTVEPIGLRLSGVMTFFFNILYFQHHFHRIAEWKKTGVLSPQK